MRHVEQDVLAQFAHVRDHTQDGKSTSPSLPAQQFGMCRRTGQTATKLFLNLLSPVITL